ncbi:tRNA lysidine(34) synthetase TilS [Poseidonibacter ostreae]|jgi:tRNA(Ile)-lysidine synthase|uniref:tRNA(Ile)-lysidine synthase n=1 Tax=Poseidonibacter ostreae TaxID=2654171 RepID=A0A6L4WRR5_9BACT|nr:tRNA lysidine(34) synthetase TilS [Poseidonibacter ostreae]KAB7881201.1 tRNA lysidine(34) synthetase TilS [Poseidonibacter ostreae]KAB7886465.1 tRNA lysidine(34) synthetase TilS [Poseidonibacter ostreae]KAB7891825.1 tRNA lysidine(34) synthetase TilS [Poseidonibacter ostreae]MAC83342.1 tRNA lysidine(34) synthetase TilS [Arcobacter sp.]|tara:strand:+ start:1421 stop:2401 length:981 start_codon:yes stop_codon:yes gene_type:complete
MNLDFSVIKESKNLLAFSAGIDSTALFFLLLKENIDFDIVIVNYNLREESKEELQYAKDLALKYNKEIFYKEVHLESKSNFEKTARDIRYNFFKEVIKANSYNTLITAHQLNDKLEWFLMQLSKGAGLVELIAFKEYEELESYISYKPLLDVSKDELKSFLKENSIKYFIDKSNYDEKYKRNYFRHNFSDRFLDEYKEGVKNSFKYLEKDVNSLNISIKPLYKIFQLEIYKNLNDENLNIRLIDLSLKKRGILLSQAQRYEVLRQKEITISDKVCISIKKDFLWISPKSQQIMDKKFKEKCRVQKIPKNIRAYIKEKEIELKDLVL